LAATVLCLGLATAADAQTAGVEIGGAQPVTGQPLSFPLTAQPIGAPPAAAQPWTIGADVGLGETDNVGLSSTNKTSQTMATADVDFALRQQSRLFDVSAKGDFSDYDYLQHAYGNEIIGRFDALGKVALMPERLSWVLQEDFGQAQLDPYTPLTPNNRENINYVSTGPDLDLRLGGTGFFDMSVRYADAYYQTSPFDSSRLFGSLAWGLRLSATSSISLNVDSERVLFTDTLVNTDFDLSNAYVRYTAQGARTELTANLGATEVRAGATPTSGPTTTSGLLAQLGLTRTLSPSAQLSLSASRQLTDPSSSFSSIQGGAITAIAIGSAILTSAPYTADSVLGQWSYERNRTTIKVSARCEKDTYQSAPAFNNSRYGGEFSVERQLTHEFTGVLLGRWYRTDYPFGVVPFRERDFDDVQILAAQELAVPPPAAGDYALTTVGAALAWRHGRWLEVRLRYEHNSESVTGSGSGYNQNSVFLTVGYRPLSNQPAGTFQPGGTFQSAGASAIPQTNQ
jgi:hypothetical protein